MTFFQIEIEIDASPELVWAAVRDVERWPEWTRTVTRVRLRTPPPLAVGSQAVVRQPKLPPALWRITELDDSLRSFTWINAAPGVRVTAKHVVVAIGEKESCNAIFAFRGTARGDFGIRHSKAE
jgi:uncharacterized protein YndB with AHSA1/START domain